MLLTIKDALNIRSKNSLAGLFTDLDQENSNKKFNNLFLLAPTDLGVCRNGGRRGACYAPPAIINLLKKMPQQSNSLNNYLSALKTVSFNQLELENFAEAQQKSAETIKEVINNFPGQNIIHLGGGHDHLYPLLKALEYHYKKIKVINIDAHLDTRNDSLVHSGTPLRQFIQQSKIDFSLIQIGIHPYSNSLSNYQGIPKQKMKIIPFNQLQKATQNFSLSIFPLLEKEIEISNDQLLVLSLDCDAIESSLMEGVSAVNYHGLPLHTVEEIFSFVRQKSKNHPLVSGIYEYNPLFDNLSQKGARALSALIYSRCFIKNEHLSN